MNKTTKQVFRVLGVIASILLSIVFVVVLIVTPIYSAATSLLKPQNITQIIRNIDYTEILLSNDQTLDAIGNVIGDNAEIQSNIKTYVEPIMESDVAEEIVSTYVEDITGIIQGETDEFTINEQTLSDIVNKHMDEIVTLVQENAPEGAAIPEGEIRKMVNETVDTYGRDLIKAIPEPKEIRSMVTEAQEGTPVMAIINGSTPYILYGIIALLAVLIFFCLFGRGRGFLCIGIDALIAALFLFAITAIINGSGVLVDLLKSVPGIQDFLAPIIDIFLNNALIASIIVAVSGVLCIAAYIACIIYKNKRAAATAENVPETY